MSCYRIRMKFGKDGKDFSSDVWQENLVGIWFGSWDIQDLYDAYGAFSPKQSFEVSKLEIAEHLNKVLEERGLEATVDSTYIATIKRFDEDLTKGTWVCTYFDGHLHLGQIAEYITTNEPRFDFEGQHFKAKRIENKKKFEIARLPDAFRVLASAGRETLHKFKNYSMLADLLISEQDEVAVWRTMAELSEREWFDALGPKGWESICTGYLILKYGFLPTGLTIGGTLPDFDIVGRDLEGTPIYGQCKKEPGNYDFDEKDKQAFSRLPTESKKFFFPYGGPDESGIAGVTTISFKLMEKWLAQSEQGRRYRAILRGTS